MIFCPFAVRFFLVICNVYRLSFEWLVSSIVGWPRLKKQWTFGSVSKTGAIIDNMVGIVGQDLTKGTNTPVNGQPLFEREDTLYIAKKLAEKDMEESMSYTDCFADRLDRAQLNRITETVMEYLEKQYWTRKGAKIQNIRRQCHIYDTPDKIPIVVLQNERNMHSKLRKGD